VLRVSQRGAVGLDRRLQPRRAALAFPQPLKRDAEVILRHRPLERHAIARPFLQRGAEGLDRRLQLRRAALALPQRPKRDAEVVLRPRPVERHAIARGFQKDFLPYRNGITRRGVLAAFVALPIQRVRLAFEIAHRFIRVSCWHQRGGLLEQLGGLIVVPLGHRNAALGRSQCRCTEELRIRGGLRRLAQLQRLLSRRNLRLPGLS
jgi:hypothetical protein